MATWHQITGADRFCDGAHQASGNHNGDCGPYTYGGNRYAVLIYGPGLSETGNEIHIYKSADQGQTWASTGVALSIYNTTPAGNGVQRWVSCDQIGSIIYIVYLSPPTATVTVSTFDMSTDAITGTVDSGVISGSGEYFMGVHSYPPSRGYGGHFAACRTGDGIVIIYHGHMRDMGPLSGGAHAIRYMTFSGGGFSGEAFIYDPMVESPGSSATPLNAFYDSVSGGSYLIWSFGVTLVNSSFMSSGGAISPWISTGITSPASFIVRGGAGKIARSADGAILAYTIGGSSLQAPYTVNFGSTWTGETLESLIVISPSISMDGRGCVHATYCHVGLDRVYYARRSSGVWETPGEIIYQSALQVVSVRSRLLSATRLGVMIDIDPGPAVWYTEFDVECHGTCPNYVDSAAACNFVF